MLSFLIDIGCAYAIGRYIGKLWAQVLLAIVAGWLSSILVNVGLHFVMPEMVSPGEAANKIVAGLIWHPLFTLVALSYFRRRNAKRAANSAPRP